MPEHPTAVSLEAIQDISEELLLGITELKEFEEFTIADITPNYRINQIYNLAGLSNLAAFLKMGTERMKLRNYGKISERVLKTAIENYLSARADRVTVKKVYSEPEIDHLSTIEALQRGTRAERAITARSWKVVCSELKGTALVDRKILPTAAELNMKWPKSAKSPLSDKAIKEYLDYTLIELLEVNRFGCKKVAIFSACALHLHWQLKKGSTPKVSTIKDVILEMWQSCRLEEREKKILNLRFGIQDERKHTLAEVKESFGITRERVRQIEKTALQKLRMSRHFESLPGLLIQNRVKIWNLLTESDRLKKQEWMEPLEDRLGFEYQIVLEAVDERRHRSLNMSALAYWLDEQFPSDETYWYENVNVQTSEPNNQERMNGSLMDFLDEL